MNFRDYKTASKYAEQINAGYSARLSNKTNDRALNTDVSEDRAWLYGWHLADISLDLKGDEGER